MSEPHSAPHDDDLLELIERARLGDAAAVDLLITRVREPLLQRVRWMMGHDARRLAESDDFLHATFAAALPALQGFEVRSTGSFLRWLTTIARNQIRQEVRRPREVALSALSSALGLDARPGNAGEGISVDSAIALAEAFDQLGEQERRLVELRDLEGRTFGEIAGLMGCSERQAQRLHARSLMQLGRHLRGGRNEPE